MYVLLDTGFLIIYLLACKGHDIKETITRISCYVVCSILTVHIHVWCCNPQTPIGGRRMRVRVSWESLSIFFVLKYHAPSCQKIIVTLRMLYLL